MLAALQELGDEVRIYDFRLYFSVPFVFLPHVQEPSLDDIVIQKNFEAGNVKFEPLTNCHLATKKLSSSRRPSKFRISDPRRHNHDCRQSSYAN